MRNKLRVATLALYKEIEELIIDLLYMKKVLRALFIFALIIVIYNNSSMHVTKHMWKRISIEGGYEDVLIFKIGGKYCHEYRYDWPYIYKNEKKIGYVFCIGDRMWVKKITEEANIAEYIGK